MTGVGNYTRRLVPTAVHRLAQQGFPCYYNNRLRTNEANAAGKDK